MGGVLTHAWDASPALRRLAMHAGHAGGGAKSC
jgi:hypothetical protein